ncbi:hypothetical protein PA598K_03683 [Paenibacillus sp. 598K]|nr:hypothetical protein PA598K_03683 [Paenibacillus sp. 598K]
MTTGQELAFRQDGEVLYIDGLPAESPTALFPVIRITCKAKPSANQWGRERLWEGDPSRIAQWANQRGTSVYADGQDARFCQQRGRLRGATLCY